MTAQPTGNSLVRSPLRRLFTALSSLFLTGCGPSVVAVNGGDGAAEAGPRGEGTICSTLRNDAPLVRASWVAQAAPVAFGGPLRDGLYFLVDTTVYTGLGGRTGPSDPPSRTTFLHRAGHYETVTLDPARGEFRHAGAVSTEGTSYRVATECPGLATSVFRYTSTAETLTLFFPTDEGTSVSIYARQD